MDHCRTSEWACDYPECSCALSYEREEPIQQTMPKNVVPLHETVQKTIQKDTPWACCPNCKTNLYPVFVVHDDLWFASGMEGWPCILCFEKAIGRKLKLEDLQKTPLCNQMIPCGWFLSDRPLGKSA